MQTLLKIDSHKKCDQCEGDMMIEECIIRGFEEGERIDAYDAWYQCQRCNYHEMIRI